MKAAAFAFLISVAAGAQPRIILVGDSTMAEKSGYGPGFCALVQANATCVNLAKGGRSTSSYRAEGSWDVVIHKLETESSDTWVLIQFGHNDQPGKPGRSTDLATEFPANLRRFVDEVKAKGGHAVLVTPLTRRSFKAGQLQDTLGPWADAAKKVASETGVPLLDLHTESMAAIQKMGPAEANSLAMSPPPSVVVEAAAAGNSPAVPKPEVADPNAPVFDYTHLGAKGSAYFGRMVAGELVEAIPALKQYFVR